MNPLDPDSSGEWHELFSAALNDQLDDAGRDRLAEVLKSSAGARELWFLYHDNECSLAELQPQFEETSTGAVLPWLPWRWLVATAAGIVIGGLCTSLVFGYVKPKATATTTPLLTTVDAGFEKQPGAIDAGFPSSIGVWSGDLAEIVSSNSVEAAGGRRMLRFVRASGDLAVPDSRAIACDVFQLVDLRGVNAFVQDDEATLELSVAFRDARAVPGALIDFACRVYVFAGDPAKVGDKWPLTIGEALASGAGFFSSNGGAGHQWQIARAKSIFPPRAEFAVVHIVAIKSTQEGQVAEFGEQFADEVRLTLKTQPTLPVIARR